MKKTLSYYLILASVVALNTKTLAQDTVVPTVSTKLDVAYVSKYIWRGIPQTTDGALQPSLTFAGNNGVSFNFWASQDSKVGKVTENDYTLNYAWTASKTSMNAGYIYYAFPNTSFLSTSEVYATACFGGLLSPSLSVNYDVDEAGGFYASLGAGYACSSPWRKEKPTNLNLSARLSYSSAGYNNFWYKVDKAALSDLYMSASMPFNIGNKASITPSISYSMLINDELRNALTGSNPPLNPDNFVGAVTMSYSF